MSSPGLLVFAMKRACDEKPGQGGACKAARSGSDEQEDVVLSMRDILDQSDDENVNCSEAGPGSGAPNSSSSSSSGSSLSSDSSSSSSSSGGSAAAKRADLEPSGSVDAAPTVAVGEAAEVGPGSPEPQNCFL